MGLLVTSPINAQLAWPVSFSVCPCFGRFVVAQYSFHIHAMDLISLCEMIKIWDLSLTCLLSSNEARGTAKATMCCEVLSNNVRPALLLLSTLLLQLVEL